jgi:uracil-DNA glycosylase
VWIEKELELVQPEVLVAMGATAAEALLGKSVAVMRDRGKHVASQLAPTVLVTIHPSAVLRARDDRDEMFDGFVRDLRVAAKALGRAR